MLMTFTHWQTMACPRGYRHTSRCVKQTSGDVSKLMSGTTNKVQIDCEAWCENFEKLQFTNSNHVTMLPSMKLIQQQMHLSGQLGAFACHVPQVTVEGMLLAASPQR